MKRISLLGSLIVGVLTTVSAQSAKMTNDTLTYGTAKYYTGKTVQIWYGSKPDKNFAFIWKGNILAPTLLTTADSKHNVVINKISKSRGKFYLIGTLQDVTGLEPKRITIDVEGAVDNKEIKEDL